MLLELIVNLVMSKRWKQNWQWIHELENSGKAIDELSMRQRKRKLEAVKGNAEKASSFTVIVRSKCRYTQCSHLSF